MYRPKDGIIETDLGEELILLDPTTQEMFSLNATGRAVWRMLSDHDPADVAAAISDHFAVDAKQAEDDVRDLIDRLLEAELLETGGP